MKKNVLALSLAMLIVLGAALAAQAAKAPVKKPAAKKPTTTNKATMGTTQLKGDQAQIGTTYTLGKTNPINFTLKKVEYRVDQVSIDSTTYYPSNEEKLLVLHYTMHNPQKRDFTCSWSTLKFTAVDADSTNWKYCSAVGKEGKGERMYMSLKPAQKTDAFTLIKVPAKGEIPKLIVESGDHLVLRYDLRGKVKGIPAPLADPEDSTGATALAEVPAQKGEYYPMGHFDLKLDNVELKDGPLGNYKAKKGDRFLVATYTIKNKHSGKSGIRWSTFKPVLKDEDGVACRWYDELIRASRDDRLPPTDIEPGDEFSFRHLFEVPGDVPLKSLTLGTGSDSRVYIYDMSDVK